MSKRIIIGVLLALLAAAGWYIARSRAGFNKGQELLDNELWPQAREQFSRYLQLHPNHAQARILMAEAFARDDGLPAGEAASSAMNYLAGVRDSSPLASEARLQAARLCFLILHRPNRAEQLLKSAIELQPDNLSAHQLRWTLLNLTGRAELAEDVFWQVYELSPEDERALRLRDWYMSQFSPLTTTEPLDRMMGILAPDATPTRTSESGRYIRFREAEPEAPVNHAALAQWCQQEGDPTFAAQLIEAAAKELPAANSDPFFLAVSIAVSLDLGQFEEAEASFARWPADDRGQLYWRWRALIYDDVKREHEVAAEAYDNAIELWPGAVDWRLHHRRANCLARLKRTEEATLARERASKVQALMTAEGHAALRVALASLNDPEQLTKVAQFYRDLGRQREADSWKTYIQRLNQDLTQQPASP